MATLIIIIIYIINFSYQYNLTYAYYLNTFSTSSIIINHSIKKVKTLRKWNSIPEKKKWLTAWEENRRIEFHFRRNQWSSMCNYKDETKKKVHEKTKSGKEWKCRIWFDSDWRRSSKAKTNKRKYQIEEDEDDDIILDDLKKKFCIKKSK